MPPPVSPGGASPSARPPTDAARNGPGRGGSSPEAGGGDDGAGCARATPPAASAASARAAARRVRAGAQAGGAGVMPVSLLDASEQAPAAGALDRLDLGGVAGEVVVRAGRIEVAHEELGPPGRVLVPAKRMRE